MDGDVITGSHLVIAAGGQAEYFGVPGAAEHAFPLYTVADAERLRLHFRSCSRRRATTSKPSTTLSTWSWSVAGRPGSRSREPSSS